MARNRLRSNEGTVPLEIPSGSPPFRSDLDLLSEMARMVGLSQSPRSVLEHIVGLATKAVGAERASIESLVGNVFQGSIPVVSVVSEASSIHAIPLSPGLLQWILTNREAFRSENPQRDPRIPGAYPEATPHNILCAPMMVRGEILGLLIVCNKRGPGGFTPEDQSLVSILASQAAQVLENERLLNGERLLLDYQEELQVASRIQGELLPKRCPDLPGYEVCSFNLPARVVGGDYFDFIPMGDGRQAICIGDVCGKGLPAALLMANLQAIVRTQSMFEPPAQECLSRCQRFFDEPARQCIERCNRLLQRCTTPDRFVTLFYGILDTGRNSLLFTNAGHNPPLLCRAGNVQRLRMGGIPLGIEKDWCYGQEAVDVEPEDLIVLYSDGVTEARNPSGEEFGEERILSTIRGYCSRGMGEILEAVRKAVRDHLSGAPQEDDMTLILLRRHAP